MIFFSNCENKYIPHSIVLHTTKPSFSDKNGGMRIVENTCCTHNTTVYYQRCIPVDFNILGRQ